MARKERTRKVFRKLRFDSKSFSRRAKRTETATVRHAHKFIISRLANARDVRRHIISWLLLVGAMIIAVGAQTAWFTYSYQTTAAAPGGTYAEASLGPIQTLNPLYATSDAELAASRLMFSSLYQYDSTGHLQGDLAQSMTVSADSTIYTVHLKPNLKWQDGQPLTARDVAYTVNLMKNPATGSSLISTWQDIQVKALDATHVQFTLPAVYAPFPNALTFPVVPQHILGSIAPSAIRQSNFSLAPIGSGPFTFQSLQTVNSATNYSIVHMTASTNYYKGTPLLARFEIHAYDTQKSVVTALQTNEVNAATDLTGSYLSQALAMQGNKATTQPVNSGVYALLNTASPTLKDKSIRQALQLVTNTKAIRAALSPAVPALDLPFINGQLTGDVPSAPAPNATAAGKLLDQDGWTLVKGVREKDGAKLQLNVVTTKNAQYQKALQVLASQWRSIGVVVNPTVIDTSDPTQNFVANVLQPRNYDVLLYELSIGADPDVYAYWHSSQIGANGYNFSNYSNPISDDALATARARLEPDLRNAKYLAFATEWLADVPAIGLYQQVTTYVQAPGFSSVNPRSVLISPDDRYDNILYWSANQSSVYKTP